MNRFLILSVLLFSFIQLINDQILKTNLVFASTNQIKHIDNVEKLNKKIEHNPDNAHFYYKRAYSYNKLGYFEKAIQDSTIAIEIRSNRGSYYNTRGLAYTGLVQYESAIKDYNKAIELITMNSEFHKNRGIAYKKLGNYEKALNDFNKAINFCNNRNDKQKLELLEYRGEIYLALGKTRLAKRDFKRSNSYTKNISSDTKIEKSSIEIILLFTFIILFFICISIIYKIGPIRRIATKNTSFDKKKGQAEYELRLSLVSTDANKIVKEHYGLFTYLKFVSDGWNEWYTFQGDILKKLLRDKSIISNKNYVYTIYVMLSLLAVKDSFLDKEISYLKLAIEIKPDDFIANYRLGICLELKQDAIAAINHYKISLKSASVYTETLRNFILEQIKRVEVEGPMKKGPTLGLKFAGPA